jgi:WD40 repeat protein
MKRGLATLLLTLGCGRGLHRDPGVSPAPPDAGADRAVLDAAADPPDTAPADRPDPPPDATLDSGPADRAVDGRPDVAPPPVLPASTTWQSCGHLGGSYPTALKHNPTKDELLVGSGSGAVDLFPLAGGNAKRLDASATVVMQAAFSPDGALMATLDIDGLRLWEPDRMLQQQKAHSLVRPRVVQISPVAPASPGDPRLILIAGDRGDSNVQVWALDGPPAYDLHRVHAFSGSPEVAFSADGSGLMWLDGRTFATGDLDGKSSRKLELEGDLSRPTFSPDGALVAGVDPAGAVTVYETAGGKRLWTQTLAAGLPERLFFVGGRYVMAVGLTQVAMFFASTGAPSPPVALPARLVAIDPAPDGASIAGVTEDGKLVRVALPTGAVLPGPAVDPAGTDEVVGLSASPDGRYLGLTGVSPVIWDLTTRTVVALAAEPQLEFSPGSDVYAASGSNCDIVRLDDGSAAPRPPPMSCGYSLVFSPAGTLLAGVSDSLGLNVFSSEGRVLKNLTVMVAQHPAVRFSPDGAWLAASNHQLWATGDWSGRWTPAPPSKPEALEFRDQADAVAWSPDGARVLLTVGYGTGPIPRDHWTTTTTLVSVPDGKVLTTFPQPFPRQANFSPDGSWIVAGPQVIHLASGTHRTLDVPASVSLFLPDGRIAAAQRGEVVTFYCPK